jgi:KDO2-lipid IV(A) lauroyltransferase
MDQSPSNARRCHWMRFLNQDTGVSYGAEKFARDYNLPVVYARINKLSRGHYSLDVQLVTEHPNSLQPGEIVEKLMRLLERDINHIPEYWLWTHKRWKRKKPADVVIAD